MYVPEIKEITVQQNSTATVQLQKKLLENEDRDICEEKWCQKCAGSLELEDSNELSISVTSREHNLTI